LGNQLPKKPTRIIYQIGYTLLQMKTNDLKILATLRKNARMPLTKISRSTHIPVSTIFDKIKTFENKIIKRHTSLVDFRKLGYSIRSHISMKVDKEDRDGVKQYLIKHQMTNSVYKINNGFDFLAEVIFHNISQMEEFIENIENKFKLTDHKSYFILEDLKRENFISDPEIVI